MDFRYILVYSLVNVFCIATMLIIVSKLGYNVGSDMEVRMFRHMSVAFIVFLFLEILWVLTMGGAIHLPLKTGGVIKVIDTMCIPVMVLFWFLYAETRFKNPLVTKRSFRLLVSIPVILMVILYAASTKTGIVMSVAEDGTLIAGPLVGLTGMVDNLYGIAIVIHACILLFREKVLYRRNIYRVQIVFIVICTIGGIADAVIQNTPIMPLAITLSFIYLFSNLQEGQIYHDALTGLNNRRRADNYLEDITRSVSEENPFYLFMLDVDRFKQINDTMGHLEGDRALQAVATAMSAAADKYHGFTARWGGDEFLIIVPNASPDFPEDFIASIRDILIGVLEERSIPYPLSVTAGYARCTSYLQKASDLIATADRMLYQKKHG